MTKFVPLPHRGMKPDEMRELAWSQISESPGANTRESFNAMRVAIVKRDIGARQPTISFTSGERTLVATHPDSPDKVLCWSYRRGTFVTVDRKFIYYAREENTAA